MNINTEISSGYEYCNVWHKLVQQSALFSHHLCLSPSHMQDVSQLLYVWSWVRSYTFPCCSLTSMLTPSSSSSFQASPWWVVMAQWWTERWCPVARSSPPHARCLTGESSASSMLEPPLQTLLTSSSASCQRTRATTHPAPTWTSRSTLPITSWSASRQCWRRLGRTRRHHPERTAPTQRPSTALFLSWESRAVLWPTVKTFTRGARTLGLPVNPWTVWTAEGEG